MDDKYLDLLNSEIKYVHERAVNAQDMADEAEANAAELREEADKLGERCKLLKWLKAEHLCPFKPGDISTRKRPPLLCVFVRLIVLRFIRL